MLHLLFCVLLVVASAQRCNKGFTCADCVSCSGISTNDDGSLSVHIDFSDCKSTALSWACAAGASSLTCNDGQDPVSAQNGGSKCESVSSMTFDLPSDATSVEVQIHDGQNLGNFSCSSSGGCCGGDNSVATGCQLSRVCVVTVDLATCPRNEECTKDSDCASLVEGLGCGVAHCVQGACTKAPVSQGTECRASAGICDSAEVCDGTNYECPADVKKPDTFMCRASAGVCDIPEFCNGGNDCPTDVFKGPESVCRETVGRCDPQEVCTGNSASCPADVNSITQTIMKCGKQYNYCGPFAVSDLTSIGVTNGQGSNYYIPTCNGNGFEAIGTNSQVTWFQRDYPSCASACIPRTCDGNHKDISNFEAFTCTSTTAGTTVLLNVKYNYDGTTPVINGCGPTTAVNTNLCPA